jgi:hypothetical protein
MTKGLLISQAILYLGLAVSSGLSLYNRHCPKPVLAVQNRHGQKVEISYDEAKYLRRLARHTGLTSNAINVLYSLKYKPASVEFWKSDKAYQDGIDQLLDRKWVFERDGLWLLTHDGEVMAHDD